MGKTKFAKFEKALLFAELGKDIAETFTTCENIRYLLTN